MLLATKKVFAVYLFIFLLWSVISFISFSLFLLIFYLSKTDADLLPNETYPEFLIPSERTLIKTTLFSIVYINRDLTKEMMLSFDGDSQILSLA